MKKFNLALDERKVERLRDVARRKVVLLGRDVTWVTLLREAADHILAAEDGGQQGVGNRTTVNGGAS